ncbi:LOC362433 (predicted) [Rattus norvegicus]|uniref:LOC362433 (Predicted) n=2 Tax=Rattus norvegicus TaxID=10116 RepID=A6ILI1_RAT|nr:uncharacterized protein LOC362433 [Rattus norvegicus]EDM01960.1 LOC362433 (predicted) [Rattus norvegicus]|eukprot:NP_001102115.1 uncharacterized protein LOC362433 [Rattus norvegicus]
MAEIEPGINLFPNGVPWLYAVFAILFVFFLFVMFSPFLLEIDQHIKKFFLRCRCSLRNASRKDKDSIKVKMNHLGGARSLLQTPGREAPRKETTGGREDSSILVEIVGERTREVCPVTPV